VICDIGEPMAFLLQLMDEHQIRHVPITRDGLLFGIVSILDVINYRLADIDAEARALKAYVAGNVTHQVSRSEGGPMRSVITFRRSALVLAVTVHSG
jgi:CBS domain-containing protein